MNRRIRGKRRRNYNRGAVVRRNKILLIGGAVLAVLLLVFFLVYSNMKKALEEMGADVIWNNIYIENVDVSGMKVNEARDALLEKTEEYSQKTVVLKVEQVQSEVALKDFGLRAKDLDAVVDKAMSVGKKGSVWTRYRQLKGLEDKAQKYDVTYALEESAVKNAIETKLPPLKDQAQNATIKREDGKFIVADGKSGQKVDLEKSIKVIDSYFAGDWKNGTAKELQLFATVDEPDIQRSDLEKIKDQLGTFSTSFSTGSNRGKNITNAAGRINGMVLMPGEEGSASTAMGDRTAANGYLEAGSYLDGQTVQSLGGGVCQVSTTLYNAIIMAELEITERWSHSMTVDYVKPSMDAAIAEGYKDLKFKNNTDAPIYIEGYTKGGKITFTVYGQETRSADRKVSYVSEVISKTDAKKKFVASGDAVGTLKRSKAGHDAIKSKLWKVVTENGVEVSRDTFNSSNYASSTATWSVGTATDNAQAKKVLTDAIKTQDEAKIKAAIEQAKQIIAAAQPVVQPDAGTTTTPPAGDANAGTGEQ